MTTQNAKPVISDETKILLGVRPENFEGEGGVGVGKLLVGPNGPVDANAAAKVAAAGTMPINAAKLETLSSVDVIKTPSTSNTLHPPRQCVLRCDCCSVTVNSQHQLDLHLNGNDLKIQRWTAFI